MVPATFAAGSSMALNAVPIVPTICAVCFAAFEIAFMSQEQAEKEQEVVSPDLAE